MNFEIVPAMLVKKAADLKRQFMLVEGKVSRAQVDIVDGLFADNKTIEIETLKEVSSSLLVDAHLMVKEPINFLDRCDQVGIERVYGQIEQMNNIVKFVEEAGNLGMQVGLALDIDTEVEAIEKQLVYLDGVLLMSVKAGFAGQEFDEKVLAKIEELREQEFKGDICVDGGLDREEISRVVGRGANHLAVGSALWKAIDLDKKLEELRGATV